MPANSRNPSNFLFSFRIAVTCASNLFRIDAVGLNRTPAVIGDPQIFEAEFLRGFGHLFERIVTIARSRVAMKRAAQIFLLDQFRQRVLFGRFELAAVLSQLRRNEIEIDRAIQIGFIAHLWNFLQRSSSFSLSGSTEPARAGIR